MWEFAMKNPDVVVIITPMILIAIVIITCSVAESVAKAIMYKKGE
jgi:hypothetical protein